MTPSQIITADCQRNGVDPNYYLKTVAHIVSTKLGILLQQGDTILLVIRIGSGNAELHISTADSPIRVKSAVKYFINKLKDSEIHTVYGPGYPKDTIAIIERMGIPVKKSNRAKYGWMASI